MTSDDLLIFLIIAGLVILTFMVFTKPLKILLRTLIQGIGGVLGLLVFNFLLSPFGWYVGINWATIFVIAVLGIPGMILLYLLNIFF
ncbi:MAG: SigmaK-factor processing regulatory protein BofA [Epulopiscium sp.]|uniref:Transcriptional regulator n=1 Tax=Defluviitalea raffinosedens TaxID=1450156 RepID=A0A7C8LF44_9FIRM|nr:pro-sigmaK processing inhibitor BofA family protein [Defluviitalea raffinosedens]MBZ4668767.1 SigmaK-factor processing regulatory protein BofA [Defluviitaleaceae bacterium]MDK2786975.1 SigmaK-factor processing regulatory protein BofA [Candidatus Epulonipiscium sp.]KAE9627754.1 transcriptional regulator [Defluviitalea raffinosedens]MBM7686002.1 inhibitor of the pro-sigma K processing machinery [Defluviitalea raffinosedens]HHW67752.1 transcriptional regulator [Candidatus Epulonipiscium sp.]